MSTWPPKYRRDGSDGESCPPEELPLSSGPPLAPSRVRIMNQAGKWVVTLVFASLTLLTASLVILSWIWFGGTEDERWRQLILGPNSDLAITLTSVAIRASVATLSWISASMMASVVVERYGVPPDRVAQASIARYTGALISLTFGGYAMKRIFKIIIPLQLACTITSQFSSTLLFSDLGTITLTGLPKGMGMSYEFGSFNHSAGLSPLYVTQTNYATAWSSYEPLTFETFAEYAEPQNKILADEVDDTGPVWRAFLPIVNESLRTSVGEYAGVARVFDARTICVRPDILNLTYQYQLDEEQEEGMWRGAAFLDTSRVPDIFDPENVRSEIVFFCSHRVTKDAGTPGHQWVMCDTEDMDAGHEPLRIGSLDPISYNLSAIDFLEAEETRWKIENRLTPSATKNPMVDEPSPRIRMQDRRTGDGYILMDVGSEYSSPIYSGGQYEQTLFGEPVSAPLSILSSVGNGPWNDFEAEFNASFNASRKIGENLEDWDDLPPIRALPFRATYCMDVLMPIAAPVEYLNITVTGEGGFAEPKSYWLQNESRYVTKDMRRQLGATDEALTASDRGVLTLSKASLDRAIEDEVKTANMSYGIGYDDELSLPARGLYTKHGNPKSLASSPDSPNDPQPFWDDFFSEAMEETGSPALAIQALNTAAARMLYTRWLPSFTQAKRAEVATIVNARAPVRAVGYSLVVAIISVQVMLLIAATVMFRACRSSMLDNVWAATAQVAASPEVEHLLARAGTMTDAEVTRYVRGERKAWWLVRREKVARRLAVRDGVFRPLDEDEERRGVWPGVTGWRRVYEKMPRQRKTERKVQPRAASPSSGEEE